jgi:O-phospho-L-seryl-tRNASec:L-selenocysteinyl-tRNA synthase
MHQSLVSFNFTKQLLSSSGFSRYVVQDELVAHVKRTGFFGMEDAKEKQEEQQLVQSLQSLGIPKTHVTVGLANVWSTHRQFRSLHKRLPDVGWSEFDVQLLLSLLATLDTNVKEAVCCMQNNTNNSKVRWCGVGEREGRVYSNAVLQRHGGFSHGIGRSGDLTEPQPKAVGSSILYKLTCHWMLDVVRRACGLHPTTTAAHGIVVPLCTGMTLALVLSSLRQQYLEQQQEQQQQQQQPTATNETDAPFPSLPIVRDVVLWSRIDQKSCYKAILASGLHCVVIPTQQVGDAVCTNLDALQSTLKRYTNRVLAIITTTSCFAPRVPDAVDAVARLCRECNVPHIINHAYGLQCAVTNKLLNRACVVGRVDAIVCSTDKNFLVPVGGALVVSPSRDVIRRLGAVYAGRASAAPTVDLATTLLSMGISGYQELLQQREQLRTTFQTKFAQVATAYGERLLDTTERNTISFAMTLDGLVRPRRVGRAQPESNNDSGDTNTFHDEEDMCSYLLDVQRDLTRLGSMLFSRCVSGTRVVPRNVTSTIGTQVFVGFGSSCNDYPHAYLTAACALGLGESEMNELFDRLEKTLREFKKKRLEV